ncbi:acyl-CoA thioesterase [Pinisolibacter sp.]|uniref:acyl-CoA thioesterase n=1 Tax=Pinisolibacter sp. TaxID=2172024 RepID=UPI002FDC839B
MTARTRKTETLTDYPAHLPIQTRWMDNDAYGHVNNVVYYSWFDTAVNRFLIDRGVLDIAKSEVIGLVVATNCAYFAPVAFPDDIVAGLRVAHLGRSSVRYEVGLFRAGDPHPAAAGEFTHVYVDRATTKPVALPEKLRAVLEAITHPPAA